MQDSVCERGGESERERGGGREKRVYAFVRMSECMCVYVCVVSVI